VLDRQVHVGEIADFRIRAYPPLVHDQCHIHLRKLPHHPFDYLAARVIGTMQAEHHLVFRIVLVAAGAQAFIQAIRGAVHGEHDCDRRFGALGRSGPAAEAVHLP